MSEKTRPLVYIAGKFTAPTRCEIQRNIQAAREAAVLVAAAGAFPIVPHLLDAGIEDAGDAAFWYEGTLELAVRCDALFTVEGWATSRGARQEVFMATAKKIPVFSDIAALRDWVQSL